MMVSSWVKNFGFGDRRASLPFRLLLLRENHSATTWDVVPIISASRIILPRFSRSYIFEISNTASFVVGIVVVSSFSTLSGASWIGSVLFIFGKFRWCLFGLGLRCGTTFSVA